MIYIIVSLAMVPLIRALVRSQGQERNVLLQICFEASITIATGGMDTDITLLVKLRKFIEEEYMVGSCFVECDGALTHNISIWVSRGILVV